MHLVSKVLVSGSMLALGLGMMGSAASAATFNGENTQTYLQAASKEGLSLVNVDQLNDYSTFIIGDPFSDGVVDQQLTENTTTIQMEVNIKAMQENQIGVSMLAIRDSNGNPIDDVTSSLETNGDTGLLTFKMPEGLTLAKGDNIQMIMANTDQIFQIFETNVQ